MQCSYAMPQSRISKKSNKTHSFPFDAIFLVYIVGTIYELYSIRVTAVLCVLSDRFFFYFPGTKNAMTS